MNSLHESYAIVETETTGAQFVPAHSRLVTTFHHIPSIFLSAFGQLPVLTRMKGALIIGAMQRAGKETP